MTIDDGQQTAGPPSKLPRRSLALDSVSIVDCFIDTGAEVSIVSPPVVERAGAAISVTEKAPSLYAAKNQPLSSTGTTRLTVSPGGFSHEFAVIEDFAYPVLLGAVFLTREGVVFDLKRGVVSIATDSPNEVVHLQVRRVFSQAESCPGELVNISAQPQPRTRVISRGMTKRLVTPLSAPIPMYVARPLADRAFLEFRALHDDLLTFSL